VSVSLYTMSAEWQRLVDLADQAGTPEDAAMFEEAMRVLSGDITDKCDRIGAVLATMDAEMEALQHEEQRLRARREAIDSNKSRLKVYAQECMEAANMTKCKGPRFTLIVSPNPEKVIIDDEAKILSDPRFVRYTESVAKSELSAVLKRGEAVPGAHLERGKSLRVR
jgi:hypothetical protein